MIKETKFAYLSRIYSIGDAPIVAKPTKHKELHSFAYADMCEAAAFIGC